MKSVNKQISQRIENPISDITKHSSSPGLWIMLKRELVDTTHGEWWKNQLVIHIKNQINEVRKQAN